MDINKIKIVNKNYNYSKFYWNLNVIQLYKIIVVVAIIISIIIIIVMKFQWWAQQFKINKIIVIFEWYCYYNTSPRNNHTKLEIKNYTVINRNKRHFVYFLVNIHNNLSL